MYNNMVIEMFGNKKTIQKYLINLKFNNYAGFLDFQGKRVFLNEDGRILAVFKNNYEVLNIKDYNVSVKLPTGSEITFTSLGNSALPIASTYHYYFVFAKKESNKWERQYEFIDEEITNSFIEWLKYYRDIGILENYIEY